MYTDFNNQSGHALSEPTHYVEFKWVENTSSSLKTLLKITTKSDIL